MNGSASDAKVTDAGLPEWVEINCGFCHRSFESILDSSRQVTCPHCLTDYIVHTVVPTVTPAPAPE